MSASPSVLVAFVAALDRVGDGSSFAVAAAGLALPALALWAVATVAHARRRPAGSLDDTYRAIFDAHPQPMWVLDDASARFLAVNDAAVFKYGYTRTEFLAGAVADLCPAEDVGRVVGAAADGRPVRWRHRTKAGVLLDAEATARRCRFAGRPARLVLAGDGTDRRRTAVALREREELLRNVIAHIPCGVFWKNRASIYLGCNDQAARDAGFASPGEVVGLTDYEMTVDPAEAADTVAGDRLVMETGTPMLETEEVRTLPGGKQVTLLTSRVPLRDPAGTGITGVLGLYIDITERKRLEEQYRQAQKMDAVGRLAGGIAHDFNNLLTVIRGNAELLHTAAGNDPDAARMVDEVRLASERAAVLVRQLLTFSRPHAAKPRVVDLNAVVADLAGILRRLLGAGVTVEVDLAPHTTPVLADRAHLEQVVMNLAVNARDAMPGGGRLRLAVGAAAGPNARLARLTVADTGCGMTADVMAKIFDPFFTTKGPDKGTGLGLAVVHGIVKQGGGAVAVDSTPGVGTTFRIDFPWSDRAPSPSAALSARDVVRTPLPARRRSVLLVEDEDGIRTLARFTLEGCGFAVTEASDGAVALDILATGQAFDLLVTDMTMPEVGGREVAARAVAAAPRTRVVYMSGYVPDDAYLADPPGAQFLPKPFTPTDLVRVVGEAVAGRPAMSAEVVPAAD